MSSSERPAPQPVEEPTAVGRYLIFDEIGVGGMASVHLGLLSGAVGFRRIVAIKQLHSRFVGDPDFVAQFINEARLAARIHHTNVVQTLDVVWTGGELLVVMEYVDGDTLNRVLKSTSERGVFIPIDVACSLMTGALNGLHAAHEVRDEDGAPLNIVHRDVSPQNILIARDGAARVLDFGVAKAAAQGFQTESGLLKGKFGYMAPEQIMRSEVDRRTDVFAAGVVFWETLTRRRLFQTGKSVEKALSRLLSEEVSPPSKFRPQIPKELDAIVMRAIDRDPDARFQTAEAFAIAIERAVVGASHHLVKSWFEPIASPELAHRARLVQSINKRHAVPGRVLTPWPGESKIAVPLPPGTVRIGPDEETRMVGARSARPEAPGGEVAERSGSPDVSTSERVPSSRPDVARVRVRSETPFGHASSHPSSVSAAGVESRAPGHDKRPLIAGALLGAAIVLAVLVIVLGREEPEDRAGSSVPAAAPSSNAAAPPRESPEQASSPEPAAPAQAPPPDASAGAAEQRPAEAADIAQPEPPDVPATPPSTAESSASKPKPRNARRPTTRPARTKKKPNADLKLRPSR